MTALVDYDNLDVLTRRRGVHYAIDSVLQTLGRRRVAGSRVVTCRLYGGWFEGAALSRRARDLIPDLRREFPSRVSVTDGGGTHTIIVRAELALALSCDPKVDLTHTYRRRSLPPRLRCVATPFPDCAMPLDCPVASLDPFIRGDACPVDGCAVTPGTVLVRAEQKLVDSMMVVDLAYLAQTTGDPLVLVSADDDLWPGIRFALLHGARLTHVVPRRGESAPGRYRRLETPNYAKVLM